MKLISKTTLNYLYISIPLMFMVGAISYFLIRNELKDGIDENLEREKLNVQKLIESLKAPENMELSYDHLSYIKIVPQDVNYEDQYSDTSIYKKKKKKEPKNYRMLRSTYLFNGINYEITITRTVMEEEELMQDLFLAFALVIFFLVLSFLIVNWLLSKKLWQPFYRTLSVLGSYDVKHHAAAHFQQENITEFNRLNVALNKMTEKIHRDFLQQKEFTENASHEMQTPLAIVRANVSLLMQSPHLQETEMNQLQAIENTVRKLTSLNKTLILLSKIENNQYHDTAPVAFKEKIEASLDLFSGNIQAKHISVTTEFFAAPVITMNNTLADVLINNLLQNAIRHNLEGGKIKISLSAYALSVSNSGAPLTISEEELFIRFKKNDSSKDSLGLGLSIVKSIATLYGMQVRYTYKDQAHTFILYF